MEELIENINQLLEQNKLTRKSIYENLLAQQKTKPNSEKLILEAIEYGLENGLINPLRILRLKKKRGKIPEIYTIDQLIKIFDGVDRPKLAIVIWLGFFCGLRIKEVCNLRISEIDLQNKVLFVKNSKNTNRSRDGYGKDRVVSIPDIAISPIKKWLDVLNGGEWLIPAYQNLNRPIQTKTIHEEFRSLLKKCDLSINDFSTTYKAKNHGKRKEIVKNTYRYKFHTLRHTYASYLLEKGVPLENIQRSLGHQQIDTTLIYARVRDNKTKQFINDAFTFPLSLVKKESILPSENKKESINSQDPLTILKTRLAKGEIDLLTYKRLLGELSPENTINLVLDKI